ncbi:hypothetical protein ACIOHS_42620 [Streptomyces sp. NPDC088253]|uniref:hypothetical protein n=1 Tax=Streptomyces sp. NPDC088253 TaxID=3365846 RepID=UPI0037FBF197
MCRAPRCRVTFHDRSRNRSRARHDTATRGNEANSHEGASSNPRARVRVARLLTRRTVSDRAERASLAPYGWVRRGAISGRLWKGPGRGPGQSAGPEWRSRWHEFSTPRRRP